MEICDVTFVSKKKKKTTPKTRAEDRAVKDRVQG